MNLIVGILIGLIAGWVVEWFIDWRFWRRAEPEAQLQEKLRQAENEVEKLRSQLDESQAIVADAELTVEDLRQQLDELARQSSQPEDRLERVKGIGTVFAGKLKNAGVRTFAQLADQSPERIMQIIQPEEWQKIEPEAWIAQARKLAEQQQAVKSTN